MGMLEVAKNPPTPRLRRTRGGDKNEDVAYGCLFGALGWRFKLGVKGTFGYELSGKFIGHGFS